MYCQETDCPKYQLVTVKDCIAFDVPEFAQDTYEDKPYCTSLNSRPDSSICEYRQLDIKAYELQAIRELVSTVSEKIPEEIKLLTALQQIDEFLQI